MNITDIHSPADIKGKSLAELQQICAELRKVLIKKLSAHGGRRSQVLHLKSYELLK